MRCGLLQILLDWAGSSHTSVTMSAHQDQAGRAEAVAIAVGMPDEREDGDAALDNSRFIERHSPSQEEERGPHSYVVQDSHANTERNPCKESTHTVPYLIRRVDSSELVPCPFSSFSQLLCASYLSLVCCLLTGMCANQLAWDAKTERGEGLYSKARSSAYRSRAFIVLSCFLGVVIVVVVVAVVLVIKLQPSD